MIDSEADGLLRFLAGLIVWELCLHGIPASHLWQANTARPRLHPESSCENVEEISDLVDFINRRTTVLRDYSK